MLAEINRNVSHAFRLDREYIIVCNEHKGVFAGALLFWGHKTEDNENTSDEETKDIFNEDTSKEGN